MQKKLRDIRLFTKKIRGFDIHDSAEVFLQDFREWRKDEIVEDGVSLNGMHTPLVCGDIFELLEHNERFVLVGQACDLMIRSNGKRRASLGFLLALEEIQILQANGLNAASPFRRFELGRVFSQETTCQIDFQNMVVADLDVLDLAVFNTNGMLSISKNFVGPDDSLTEGWEKRLKKLKTRFGMENRRLANIPLSVGNETDKFKGKTKSGVLTYPVKRIGRLESNTATAVLAAWATFETRAALQYDFAAPEEHS